MAPTFNARQGLAVRFADDVARMRQCLQTTGRSAEDDDITYFGGYNSDGLCTGWLMLPKSEDNFLATLLKHLSSSRLTWRRTVTVARDGSGDITPKQKLALPTKVLLSDRFKNGQIIIYHYTHPGRAVLSSVLFNLTRPHKYGRLRLLLLVRINRAPKKGSIGRAISQRQQGPRPWLHRMSPLSPCRNLSAGNKQKTTHRSNSKNNGACDRKITNAI